MTVRLTVLPPAQRAFWEQDTPGMPDGWVLYGGTAIALQLGHRESLDFDFFSSDALDRESVRSASVSLKEARTLQDEPNTLTVSVDKGDTPVKVSFFGGISFGRVGEPVVVAGTPPVASLRDLLATKLATITQRVEARDYLDIASLLESGLTINDGVSALLALYGPQASGLQSVKAMSWFEDGDLAAQLPGDVREILTRAAAEYDPAVAAAKLTSTRLE